MPWFYWDIQYSEYILHETMLFRQTIKYCPRELESYRSICFIIRLTGQQIETLKVERTCFRVTPPSLRRIRKQ